MYIPEYKLRWLLPVARSSYNALHTLVCSTDMVLFAALRTWWNLGGTQSYSFLFENFPNGSNRNTLKHARAHIPGAFHEGKKWQQHQEQNEIKQNNVLLKQLHFKKKLIKFYALRQHRWLFHINICQYWTGNESNERLMFLNLFLNKSKVCRWRKNYNNL